MTGARRHPQETPSLARIAQLLTVAAAFVAFAPSGVLAQAVAPLSTAAPSAVAYGPISGGFALTLTSVEGNEIELRREGLNLIVTFARAVPAFDAAALQTQTAGWLDGVSVGYDALMLRLSSGVDVQVDRTSPSLLTLRFIHSANQDELAASPQPGSSVGALRLKLLQARLLVQEGQLAQARERFEALRAAAPESAEPVAGLAALESQVGRWRRSLELYRQAQKLSDNDPALTAAAGVVERAQAGGVRVEAEQRRSHGGDVIAPTTVDLAGIKASRRLGEEWKLGVDIEVASIDTQAVQRADGSVRPFSGTRNRAALYAQHDGLNGDVHVVSLFADDRSAGLGLSRRQIDDRGATTLVVEARRPSWDYIEGMIAQALRDRLAVARSQLLGRSVTGRAEVGVNRYTLPGQGEVSRTTSVAGEVRWENLGNVNGLSAAYALDAEYVNRIDSRVTAAGAQYAPLPLLDREVHAVLLGYARTFGERDNSGVLSVSGQLGPGYDRFGRSGLIATAELSWVRGAAVIQLRGSHVSNVGRSRGTTDAIAGFVSISF
jgi:tetratricopeptide (TPR) repeat protein